MMHEPEPLLSVTGLAELRGLATGRTLFAFDFDGTLAPIRVRPDDVQVEPMLSGALRDLAEIAPVAVVTGRRVEDVRPRLGFVPAAIVGNHGAEDPGDVQASLHWTHALAPLRTRLQAAQPILKSAGVVVEDKGPSIALHYRTAAAPAAAIAAIDRTLDTVSAGLRRFDGKRVVNVVGSGAPDKADAVVRLLSSHACDRLFYAGDDVNDEPVFASARPGWITTKVGTTGTTHARYFLDDQSLVATAVRCLLDAVRSRQQPGNHNSARGV